jgi:ABC-type branched-subunit amino acid transport system ATPase component
MEVLTFFGLSARAAERAEDLAYPEQKLLSMARIFATDAQVLLLDEPTSGLDTDSLARSCRWCAVWSSAARPCC